jgi:formamidopyrimidine-DNA glycosylase
MPELPEVETVKEVLKSQILNETIEDVKVYYEPIVAYPTAKEFIEQVRNQKIKAIERRGKWLLFILSENILLSHLRMEGRYYLKDTKEVPTKHDHVVFSFKNGRELWYRDTRKFGRMYLYEKEKVSEKKPLSELGLEPWDEELTPIYLKEKLKRKQIPIKTVLLDQSIVVGCGNIYADEVLFLSKIHPLTIASHLTEEKLATLIQSIRVILEKAIRLGGTTIKSYESSEGVHGRFQNELAIHGRDYCSVCEERVTKVTVGGRGTYYCTVCQKEC